MLSKLTTDIHIFNELLEKSNRSGFQLAYMHPNSFLGNKITTFSYDDDEKKKVIKLQIRNRPTERKYCNKKKNITKDPANRTFIKLQKITPGFPKLVEYYFKYFFF